MKHFVAVLAAVSALSSPALQANAASLAIKTGLWQMTSKVDMPEMPAFDMSQIPPERRAMFEQMMKQNLAKPHTIMSCVTKKDLDSDQLCKNDEEGCTHKITAKSATSWAGTMTCTGKHKGNGDMQFDAVNSETVKGVIHMTMLDDTGVPRHTTVNIAGQWMSADCGNVKP